MGMHVGQADGPKRAELDALFACGATLQLNPLCTLLVAAAVDFKQRAPQQLCLSHIRYDV
jgi:hypothetical protein